jgi:hypothetical protein
VRSMTTKPGELAPVEQAIGSLKNQSRKSPELAREAFWRLLDRIKEYHDRVKRSLALMILFALAFELLNRGLISEASVAGIKLTELESLRLAIPVAIGYVFFSAMSAIRDRLVVTSAYARASQALYPDFHESAIDAVLAPAGLITSIFPWVYVPDRTRTLGGIFSVIEHFTVELILPVGFFVYAVTQLFSQGGVASLGVWVSTILTAILIAAGLAVVLLASSEESEEDDG